MALNPNLDAVTGLILPGELESPTQLWFERYYGGFAGQRTFTSSTLKSDQRGPRLLTGSHISIQNSADAKNTRRSLYGAGANLTLRRSAFERIGGFNVALGVGTPAGGGEDLAALITISWTGSLMVYEPAAFVHHRHRRGYDELLSQLEGYRLGYTAMLTSLVLSDPRHLLSLSSQLPSALGRKITQGIEQIRGKRSGEPSNQAATSLYPSTLVKP